MLPYQRNKGKEGLFGDKRGHLRPLPWPLLKVGEEKRLKMQRSRQCLLGTRFCVWPPCQLPAALSPSVWGGLAVWSLGSITGITQPQLDHPSPHLRNRGLECQGPSVWLPDHCFGPAVDPVTWWAVSEDSPSCSGPVVCRWGRARQVAGCLGRT